NPSSIAYSGAVIGAQLRLKIVTSAVTIPPSNPPIIHGIAACGVSECAIPHVQAAVATTHSSRTPVLFTVPCKVIASPPTATSPRKAFSFSAGLEVRKGLAMFCFPRPTHPVYTRENRAANRTQHLIGDKDKPKDQNQRSGSANGNRTRILALKGLRANRCTIAPLRALHLPMPPRQISVKPTRPLLVEFFKP